MKYLTLISILLIQFSACKNDKRDILVSEKIMDPIKEIPAWYLQTQDKDVQLYVKEYGIGDTIVIVHGGFGAEHSYLIDAFEKLGNNHHLVFYDQRGSLRSPAPDSLISVHKHIQDLELLRKELNLNRLNLVGHSMGTFLCGFYLQNYPEHVERLTLLALVYPKTPDSEEEKQLFKNQQKAAAEFFKRPEIQNEIREEGLDNDSLSDKEASNKWRIGFAGTNIYNVERWREVKGGMAFYNQKAGTAAGNTLPNSGWNFINIYKETGIPITVISGSHDFADMGGYMYSNWLANIDNLEYQLIDKAGHNAWIDRPKAFYDLLEKAVEKN